ncbi:IspD/TarI family cytidylyltransferase [Luteimicrobium xylanilyticum]|uniref:2-C-methyl-D-erythritol 4-phosphate cytidylyltransferase n=1 Tax=Luteimicrobium xylanilyticum TaxID=1133546 RepID=A0A5P9QDA6_9MICO|nr:IspD/TarI family cytidylyltransferase [Luteimicrobium xylanilyticum]QFU99090.1 2-C-methyl-D-erythritol 4-phosphate cytidylyltransferase [Luteimicrobium xylanilyticum]
MYTLLLLNGGIGARVAAGQPKQLIKVRGIPILVYSLVAADAVPEIDQIVLNYPDGWRDDVERIVRAYAIKTPVTYVEAGLTRHDSVAKMLSSATNDDVLVHESARPLVSSSDFAALIADPSPNVSLMLEIPFTVAPVDPETRTVTGYLERSSLRNVQLPQKFAKADLIAAHDQAAADGRTFTEDATMVAVSGHEVRFIDGHDRNIKVTTPTDVRLATNLLTNDEEGWDE